MMPLLREESWPHVSSSVHRRLLSFPQNSQVDGPFVTFGWDTPTRATRVTHALAADHSVADLEREALENLAKLPYERTEVRPGHVMPGAEYGVEMVRLSVSAVASSSALVVTECVRPPSAELTSHQPVQVARTRRREHALALQL